MVTLINAIPPTENKKNKVKDVFCDLLDCLFECFSFYDLKIVVRYFNAKTGSKRFFDQE